MFPSHQVSEFTPLKINQILPRQIVEVGLEKNLQKPSVRKIDWSSRNFQNFSFECNSFTLTNFSKADLSQSKWKNFTPANPENLTAQGIYFGKCSFDHSNLSRMSGSELLFDTCSFVGTNFSKVNFSNLSFVGKTDLTDSNITEEQFQTIRYKNNIIYRKFSFRRTQKILKMTFFEFTDWVKSGIDIRDNETKEKVLGNFSTTKHHIPQWVVQNEIKKTI